MDTLTRGTTPTVAALLDRGDLVREPDGTLRIVPTDLDAVLRVLDALAQASSDDPDPEEEGGR